MSFKSPSKDCVSEIMKIIREDFMAVNFKEYNFWDKLLSVIGTEPIVPNPVPRLVRQSRRNRVTSGPVLYHSKDEYMKWYDATKEFFQYLKNKEHRAFLDGAPQKYYIPSTSAIFNSSGHWKHLVGVTFKAYSKEGAYLKMSRKGYTRDQGVDYLNSVLVEREPLEYVQAFYGNDGGDGDNGDTVDLSNEKAVLMKAFELYVDHTVDPDDYELDQMVLFSVDNITTY